MNLDDRLVSVIMPAYNASRFIEASVLSVLNQTYNNIELICVDDKSKDDTYELLACLASRDNRVKAVQVSKNGGPAMARNFALERATGRYIAFCDADDIWLPDKLVIQLSKMQDEKAPMSFTALRRISEDEQIKGRKITVPEYVTYNSLLKNTVITTSTVVVDRCLVGDFCMMNTFYDDFVLWLAILKPGRVALGINQDLVQYRVAAKSYSRNKWKSAYWVWKTYRDIEKLGILRSAWCFVNYAFNGLRKYREF